MIPTYPMRPLNGGEWKPAMTARYRNYRFGPKYNGFYTLVHVPTRAMFNRQGERLTISNEIDAALSKLCPTLDCDAFKWVACEALERRHGIGKGALIVLDVVPEPAHSKATYEERRSWLVQVIKQLPIVCKPEQDGVYLESWDGCTSPNGLWESLKEINKSWNMPINTPFYEGMVAKRVDAPYNIQLRNPEETSTAYVKFRWKW